MSRIIVSFKNPGFLVGMKGIELLIDGNRVDIFEFGETRVFDIPVGKHVARVYLHGVTDRLSKPLNFTIDHNQTIYIEGTYSRMWGNISLNTKIHPFS